jgi:hypothetical protein
MCALRKSTGSQMGLGGFGEGNIESLDGGQRLRLDERIDFWPATQVWQTVCDGPEGPANGIGVSTMFAFLKRARAAEGRPVAMPTPLPSKRRVTCNYCDQAAELHNGLAVYPDRKDLSDRQFWVCWSCNAWVGCHRDTDSPIGSLADEELRSARIAAHAAFDPIWKEERLPRPEAYAWLAQELGIPRQHCHIGLLELDDCRRVSQIVWERFGSMPDR